MIEARARDLVSQQFAQLKNWQANGFEPSPLQFLAHFEAIEPGPEKDYFLSKHKEVIEVGIRERDWRATRAEAARAEAFARPPAGSMASQYESLRREDAGLAKLFYEKHKTAIHAELHERQAHPASVS